MSGLLITILDNVTSREKDTLESEIQQLSPPPIHQWKKQDDGSYRLEGRRKDSSTWKRFRDESKFEELEKRVERLESKEVKIEAIKTIGESIKAGSEAVKAAVEVVKVK